MIFRVFSPCLRLSPYIENIWIQEDLQSVNYGTLNPIKVLPSTSVIMGFQYGNPQEAIRDGHRSVLSPHGVAGLQTGPVLYKNLGAIGSIIVRFKPWGASAFFKNPIADFKDQNTDANLIYGRGSTGEVRDKILECTTPEARVAVVEEYLTARLLDKPVDRAMVQVIQSIQNAQGLKRVEELAREAGLSKRQLERKFQDIVGISPKKFSSIVRFQAALQLFRDNDTLTALAYDAGYFDQAHFIKDFQSYTGQSPESFFARKLQPQLSQVFNAKSKLTQFYHSIYQ